LFYGLEAPSRAERFHSSGHRLSAGTRRRARSPEPQRLIGRREEEKDDPVLEKSSGEITPATASDLQIPAKKIFKKSIFNFFCDIL